MVDSSEKLQHWIIQELNVVSEGRLQKIPSTEKLRCLTNGKNKKIWTYVFDHVQSASKVHKIKRFLYLKHKLEDNETELPNLLSEKINALQRAIDNAKEKQTYLKESISVIQDRVIDIEKDTEIIKQETLKYNQKYAFLNLLTHSYQGKNKSLKIILNNITTLAKKNKWFRKTNFPSDCMETRTSEFQFNEIFHMLNDCGGECDLSSIVMQDENQEVSLKKLSNNLAEKSLLLPDLIVILEKLCSACLDTAMNLSWQKELSNHNTSEKNIQYQVLLKQLQYCYVSNCLQIKKTSKSISNVAKKKEKVVQILSNRLCNDQDADTLLLLEKLVENEMYAKSNMFLEDFLIKEKCGGSKILKKNALHKEKIKELKCLQNEYLRSYDMIVWLTSASEKTFQYILNEGARMFNFAHQDIFLNVPLLKKYVAQIEQLLEQERKLMWNYCLKKDIIKSHFLFKNEISTLSLNSQSALGILPFQNINKVYEKWFRLKVKLNETDFRKISFNEVYHPDNLKTFCLFIENLKDMKHTLIQTFSKVDCSFTILDKLGNLFTDWWEQNAQFIPEVKYEGKPLKMYIDVLSVLPDF